MKMPDKIVVYEYKNGRDWKTKKSGTKVCFSNAHLTWSVKLFIKK